MERVHRLHICFRILYLFQNALRIHEIKTLNNSRRKENHLGITNPLESFCESLKVHLNPKNVFLLVNSMYVEQLNSEIFVVFNVTLMSYRDLNLQNANKMTSI